jgi:S-adenosylmethionine:tRNA ribosyltransferase-isomerase
MIGNAHGDSRAREISLADFDFQLPKNSIALTPARPRSASRLLVVDRQSATVTDSHFNTLHTHLVPGDTLVVNNTRVLKARVTGKLTRSGRTVEILFSSPGSGHAWQGLIRGSRRVRPGETVDLGDGSQLTVGPGGADGLREISVSAGRHENILDLLEAQGMMPLPPYIDRPPTEEDATDYQTVFATEPGAIAAPTASLHFSPQVFEALHRGGIETVEITLHVGIGTFTPVRTEDPRDHVLRAERYKLSTESADALNRARSDGRRIIAVGTTTTRTLEHVIATHGRYVSGPGTTDLYILPGYHFRAVDGLLTNFHLPRSTLLMLVAAFASRDLTLSAYKHAIASGYRFYSYGDCCLFL